MAENHDKPAAAPLNPRAAPAAGRQARERRAGDPQPAPAAALRFQPVDLMTDGDFYMDTETGLLMVLSADIPEEKRQAELERRSRILVERLAAEIKRGPRPKDYTPAAKKVLELTDEGNMKRREAINIVAAEVAKIENIGPGYAAKRIREALKRLGTNSTG